MNRVAILDDYQNVALGMADWKSLPADTEVVVFGYLATSRLTDGSPASTSSWRMRADRFRALLGRLPCVLITAGMRNASIDRRRHGPSVSSATAAQYPTGWPGG
jgi:hypothetical protein